MAKHRIRIDYDEDTGVVTVTHRCTIELAGHSVRWSDVVTLGDPEEAKSVLKTMIDNNRVEAERRATQSALQHVAAVTGQSQRGIKRLKLQGSMGAIGEVKP